MPVPNDMATRFWWSYYGYVQENYPYLYMLRPQDTVPGGSSFFTFKPEALNLDKSDWIYHKGYGAVALQFTGKGGQLDELTERYRHTLRDGMELVKTGKSASLTIKVPRIEVTGDFEAQLPMVEEALRKVKDIFLKRNLPNVGM